MATPEGRVKNAVKKVLKKYPSVYSFWPVQTGMGKRTLDCIICAAGYFIIVETKKPGAEPTPLQWGCIYEVQNAGGIALVIDSVEGAAVLDELLQKVTSAASASFRKAPDGGCAGPARDCEYVPASHRYGTGRSAFEASASHTGGNIPPT